VPPYHRVALAFKVRRAARTIALVGVDCDAIVAGRASRKKKARRMRASQVQLREEWYLRPGEAINATPSAYTQSFVACQWRSE
jgi:hypothetical protein